MINVVICFLVYYYLLAQTSDAAIEELNLVLDMLNDNINNPGEQDSLGRNHWYEDNIDK